jgi:pimeloyl-ACP methyl ester carboxylesterase
MTMSRCLRAVAVVSLAVCLPLQTAVTAELKAKTAVLVHGAFADGSSWNKVIPILQQAGLKVVAVQNPLTSLEDDVAAARRAIRNAEGPVVLAGHSWGGVVITEAGNDPKVASLVYVAAYAPDSGQSARDITAKFPAPAGREAISQDEDGFLRFSDEGVRKYFAADLTAEEQALVAATQGPFHIKGPATAVTTAAWRNKPSFMVVATKDTVISPELEKAQVTLAGATAIEVPSSHVAMLSFPKDVAALILKAAE